MVDAHTADATANELPRPPTVRQPAAGDVSAATDVQRPAHECDRLAAVRARTPARLQVGRSGPAYRTTTYLELRCDHAAARDAVSTQLSLTRDLGEEFVRRWQLFEVSSQAADQREFLLRPDLGRRL